MAVLAGKDEIYKAREQFVACLFLAGVDRDRYKDAIDEMNNDFLRHGKEYPTDVSSMVTWLLKRCGKASSKKEDGWCSDQFCSSDTQKEEEVCALWQGWTSGFRLLQPNSS